MQKIKSQIAYTVYAQDFEENICNLRERAVSEGQNWIKGKKAKEVLFIETQKKQLQNGLFPLRIATRVTLLNVYGKKSSQKSIYRLQIESVYKLQNSTKKQPFLSYLTLEL